MFGLGVSEIVIIGVVVLILLFGSKKVVEIARSLGRVGGEFKKGQREIQAELTSSSPDEPVVHDSPRTPTTAPQDTETTRSQTDQKSS